MAIMFDINGNPPTQAQIDKEKKSILSSSIKKMIGSFVCLIGGCLNCVFGIYYLIQNKGEGYVMIFTGCLMLIIAYFITPNKSAYEFLTELKPENADFTLKLCGKYQELEKYRQKVIASERKLIHGEFHLMKEWAEESQKTEMLQKLHTPSSVLNN